jgi:4-amino-4-deoxy-L-arabinose transferase-like glycosyltransferase
LPASWSVYALIGALLGLEVLAKGPVGFLLPAASLGLFVLIMNQAARQSADGSRGWIDRAGGALRRAVALFSPRQMLRVTWAMRPLTALAFTAMVALPWYVAITWRTHGEWLAQFVTKYNLGPFVKPFLGHRGPFYYHFVVVLIGLFPWSIFLGPTVANAYRALRARGKDFPSYAFLVCWIGVFFGFWSMCSTKLPHYVLPAYPALAILTGCFIDAWLRGMDATARYIMPVATSIFLGVGVVLLAVLPWVAARYAPGEQIISLVGLVPALGGCLGWYFLAHDQRRPYMAVIATSSVLFIAMLFGWAAVHVDRCQHSRPLMEEVRRDSPGKPQIAGYKYCDASTVYYARDTVVECNDANKLLDFLARSPHPYVVTTDEALEHLESQVPGHWRVVARRPRFLAKGEIVVVAPRTSTRADVGRRRDAIERF